MTELSHQSMRVLVTRPQPQADDLANAIRAQGGFALAVPLLDIRPTPESQSLRDSLQQLDQYQKIIAISMPAVEHGLNSIENWWPQLPVGIDWYAIGEATANALQQHGITANYQFGGFDSEALLELADFQQISGQRILIIKGKNGRDKLQTTLTERGATVENLVVYERVCPDYPAGYLPQQLSDHRIHVIVATSSQIVINLQSLLNHHPDADNLKQLTLIVPSQRVAEDARACGFNHIAISEGAGTPAVLDTLARLSDTVS